MKMYEILESIKALAGSQGFYGRLYHQIMDYKKNNPAVYKKLAKELEAQNFKDTVDMVLYFEC